MKYKKCGHHGERDGKEHGGGGTGTAKKNQNHEAGQEEADSAFMQNCRDSLFYKQGLVENDMGFQLCGNIAQRLDGFLDTADHFDSVGISALLLNCYINGLLAVDSDDVVLQRGTVHRLAYVGNKNRPLPLGLERDVIKGLRIGHLGVCIYVVVQGADANITRGQDEIGGVCGANDVHWAQFVRLQLDGIHVHHDLPVLAAEGRRHGGTRNASNLVPYLILQIIVKLRFVQPLPLHSQQAHWQTRSIDLQNDRWERSLGQPAQIRHRQIRYLGYIGIRVGTGLEINLDQAYAGQRARLHVIDAAG